MSSNIVGYEKVTLNAGWNMIGVQFSEVGGNDLALATVGTLDSSMSGYDEDGFFATEMRVWDGENYAYYGWAGSSGTDVLGNSELDNIWVDDSLESDDETFSPSDGFWIKAGSSGTMTIAGEVPTAATVTKNISSGWNMVANPYPGEIKIANFGVLDSSFDGYDEDGFFATEMRIWDGENYAYYGWAGSSGTDVLGNSELDNIWVDDSLEPNDETIGFGHAVWIKTSQSGTITFTNPAQ